MFIADDEITGCVDLIRGEEPQVCGAISGYRRRISTSVEVFPGGFLCLKRFRLCLRGLGGMCWCEVEKRAGSPHLGLASRL